MSKIASSANEALYNPEELNCSNDSGDEFTKLNISENVSYTTREDNETEEDVSVEEDTPGFDTSYLSKLSLKDNSERYVVNIDEIPQFYTNTLEKAREYMWDIARARRMKETNYNCYIRETPDQNFIQVVGFHKFYVLSYERLICNMNVCRVQEIEDKVNLKLSEDLNDDNRYFFGFFS